MKIKDILALFVAFSLIALMGYFVLAAAEGSFPFWLGIGLGAVCGVLDFIWIGLSGIAEE